MDGGRWQQNQGAYDQHERQAEDGELPESEYPPPPPLPQNGCGYPPMNPSLRSSSSREGSRHRYGNERDKERERDREGREWDRERRQTPQHRSRSRERSYDRGDRRDRERDRDRGRRREERSPKAERHRRRERSPVRNSRRERDHHDHRDSDYDYDSDRRRERRRHSSGREEDYEEDWGQGRRHHREKIPPTNTLYIRGIPVDKSEAEVLAFFSAKYNGITSARVVLDRHTGQSRGFAFLDCASIEHAKALMEEEATNGPSEIDGLRLRIEYSMAGSSSASSTGAEGGMAAADWLCERCGTVNFARRLECYQCSSSRPKDPQRVNADPDGPSLILKASGLEPQTGEEELRYLVSPVVPVKV